MRDLSERGGGRPGGPVGVISGPAWGEGGEEGRGVEGGGGRQEEQDEEKKDDKDEEDED